MGLGEQWQELSLISYTSELNFLTGIGDIVISEGLFGLVCAVSFVLR